MNSFDFDSLLTRCFNVQGVLGHLSLQLAQEGILALGDLGHVSQQFVHAGQPFFQQVYVGEVCCGLVKSMLMQLLLKLKKWGEREGTKV